MYINLASAIALPVQFRDNKLTRRIATIHYEAQLTPVDYIIVFCSRIEWAMKNIIETYENAACKANHIARNDLVSLIQRRQWDEEEENDAEEFY